MMTLLVAGYTVRDCRLAGFKLKEVKQSLESVFGPRDFQAMFKELIEGEYTLRDFWEASYSLTELRALSLFGVHELRDAGYTLQQFHEAGYTAGDVADLGVSVRELKDAGFQASQMKDAGFTAAQLKLVGFPLVQVKRAGFTVCELKEAGYTAWVLGSSGFN